MTRFVRALMRSGRALDAHWLGDLLGAVALFGLLYIGLCAGAVLG